MPSTIARFSTMLDAHIARSKLEWVGIPAFVADEHLVTAQWFYSNAIGGVRVQVPDLFTEEALAVLDEDWSENLAQEYNLEKRLCSKCGAGEMEFFQFGRRAAYACILLFGFPLLPLSEGAKCSVCGAMSKT